jgi:hypothetical protein
MGLLQRSYPRSLALDRFDTHKGDGKRYIVHSDELLSALLESEAKLRERRKPRSPIVLNHRYNFIHSNPEYARNR